MEILLAALKSCGIKLPKFLLWKIANDAELELDYSCELAEYFHGENTLKNAIIRKKKLADRMAKNMGNEELYHYSKNILASCSEYLFLRISDYLIRRYNYCVFDHAMLSGNVSLLHALRQKHLYVRAYAGLKLTSIIFEAGHFQMVEYLWNRNLIYPDTNGHNRSEDVLKEIVSKMPKEAVANYFVRVDDGCPHLASVLKEYL